MVLILIIKKWFFCGKNYFLSISNFYAIKLIFYIFFSLNY